MKFGIFDHMDRATGTLGQQFEERLRLIELYEKTGFHAYHLAEHHATPLGMAPSPSVFLAAVAQRTTRLRFGPLVYTVNLYHPLRLIDEICMLDQMSGDGGLAMLLGDLLTAIQEKIPIKIAVFNNSSLGFVEMEMKAEGLLDAYTNLVNPDFARVAEAIGFHARRVERAEDLEGAVKNWLTQPGPALLDVVTSRLELVVPSHIEAGPIFGMALYSAKALLGGRAGDVWDLMNENL